MAEHAHTPPTNPSIVHILTDEDWATRTAENKLRMVAREVSRRLHGMRDILYGLAISQQAGGGQNCEHLTFLGSGRHGSSESARACRPGIQVGS